MFLCSWYKFMIYYTADIIINIENFNQSKKKNPKKQNKTKNPLNRVIS